MGKEEDRKAILFDRHRKLVEEKGIVVLVDAVSRMEEDGTRSVWFVGLVMSEDGVDLDYVEGQDSFLEAFSRTLDTAEKIEKPECPVAFRQAGDVWEQEYQNE